ncbi:MAG: hypothetical protein ABIK31_05560 [candidate division WOR-3 bacterium]
MKHLLLKMTLINLCCFTIFSCKKEVLTQAENGNSLPMNRTLESEITFIANPLPIEYYLVNSEDSDDEKINRQLYAMTMTSKALFKDNLFNNYIFTQARKNDNHCADLRNFVNSTELRNLSSDKDAFDSLRNLVLNADFTHLVTNDGNTIIENYIPALFVPNIEWADISKQPIITSGTYVNNGLNGAEGYQDYIVAWFPDENGNFIEFILNEEMAQRITHPIFVFDNAEEAITLREKSKINYENPELKNMNTAWYSSHEYQINHRYDNTNNSEFCITGVHIDHTGTPKLICRKSNGTYDTWKKIAEVHKNHVGSLRYQWEQFCSNTVVPFNQNFIFWNTYERDWAKSPKDLGTVTRNGATIYLNGRRTYSGEWYAYDPSQLNNNPVDLNTIYNTWAKWHDNSKGRFRIWRIQP